MNSAPGGGGAADCRSARHGDLYIAVYVHVTASNESVWYAIGGAKSSGGDAERVRRSVHIISNASFHDDVSAVVAAAAVVERYVYLHCSPVETIRMPRAEMCGLPGGANVHSGGLLLYINPYSPKIR